MLPVNAPLRVLTVHNQYRQRGGEDAVVDAEEDLLQHHGHEVLRYRRHNDEVEGLGRLRLAAETVWSRRTTEELAVLIERFKPDVMHVHNTLTRVSPSVYWVAHRYGVPVVQTLHNFRLMCPQALLLRDGRVCEDCVGRLPWRAVAHRCYRDSAVQSAVVAVTIQSHRWMGTWSSKVARYIALNEFCRNKFIEAGLPRERISVKPNFVDLPMPDASRQREGFLFVGRLSAEKGIDNLLQAAALTRCGAPIRVIGTGPEMPCVAANTMVELLGEQPAPRVYDAMSRARALVLPSIWYENHPRTLVEAFACGVPVIASRMGALASLVSEGHTGLLFNPGDPADLAARIDWAHRHPDEMEAMGTAARTYYEQHLTGQVNYRRLIEIYGEAIATRP